MYLDLWHAILRSGDCGAMAQPTSASGEGAASSCLMLPTTTSRTRYNRPPNKRFTGSFNMPSAGHCHRNLTSTAALEELQEIARVLYHRLSRRKTIPLERIESHDLGR